MILELLRRDPAVRALPRWLILGIFCASALEGMRTWVFGVQTWKSGAVAPVPHDLPVLVLVLWLPVVLYAAYGRTAQRCLRFDLALPISARRLWTAHMLGMAGSSLVLLVAAASVVRVRDALVGMLPGAPVPPSNVLALLLPMIASAWLALAVLQLRDLSSYRIHAGGSHGLQTFAVLALAYGVALALARLPAAASAIASSVPLALAAAIVVHARRSLPESFTIVPRDPEAGAIETPSPSAADDSWERWQRNRAPVSPGERWRVYPALFQVLIRGIAPGQMIRIPVMLTFGYPFLVAWGLLCGIPLGDQMHFMMIVISAYVLFVFLGAPLAQVHAVDPLPVSRRSLFALVVLPAIAAISLGYGAGWITGAGWRNGEARVAFQRESSRWLFPPYRSRSFRIRVPVEHCGVAWDGQAPRIGSPWGESYPAWTLPISEVGRAVVYSPFMAPDEASREFVALQISRAVEAVYGITLPPDEISERYLTVDGEGKVVARDESGLDLLRDHPELRAPSGPPLFPVFMASVVVLYMLAAAIYLLTLRATVPDRRRKVVFFTIAGILLAMHLVQMAVYMPGIVTESALCGLAVIALARAVAILPGGPVAIWLVSGAVAWVAYLVARARFLRIEMPAPRGRVEA